MAIRDKPINLELDDRKGTTIHVKEQKYLRTTKING
jgi:hypothetical protein